MQPRSLVRVFSVQFHGAVLGAHRRHSGTTLCTALRQLETTTTAAEATTAAATSESGARANFVQRQNVCTTLRTAHVLTCFHSCAHFYLLARWPSFSLASLFPFTRLCAQLYLCCLCSSEVLLVFIVLLLLLLSMLSVLMLMPTRFLSQANHQLARILKAAFERSQANKQREQEKNTALSIVARFANLSIVNYHRLSLHQHLTCELAYTNNSKIQQQVERLKREAPN